jgi:hypothetical protein
MTLDDLGLATKATPELRPVVVVVMIVSVPDDETISANGGLATAAVCRAIK